MKLLTKTALAAGLALASLTAPLATAPAMAQTAQKIAIVNLPAVIANSTAYQAAQTAQQTTYAAQLQQAEQRRAALQAQINPLMTAFQTARQAANPDQAALQQQAQQIQQLQQSGQAELNQILAPISRSEAYVTEQIEERLGAAVQAAAQAAGVTLVVSPDTVLWADNSHNLNEAVLNQLNTMLPSVQVTPPEGWVPREMRQQQEAAAQAQAAQGQPATSGR
ncbi:OmpH family outer membrane protein [Aurantiacibacter flavus]|uniref:OmpH family outer membrane protein n=1 Tax=Aurantiacibacter flavus TaxID=3145232 RepID=A0ABV0CU78_9SPHN